MKTEMTFWIGLFLIIMHSF